MIVDAHHVELAWAGGAVSDRTAAAAAASGGFWGALRFMWKFYKTIQSSDPNAAFAIQKLVADACGIEPLSELLIIRVRFQHRGQRVR